MPLPQQGLRHRDASTNAKGGNSVKHSHDPSNSDAKKNNVPQSELQSSGLRSPRRLSQRIDSTSTLSRQRTSQLGTYLAVAFVISYLFFALHFLSSTSGTGNTSLTDLSRVDSLRLWKRFVDDEDRKDMLRDFRAALGRIGDDRGMKIMPMHDYDHLHALIAQQRNEVGRVRERLRRRLDEIERYRVDAASARVEREHLVERFVRPDAHSFHLWCGSCRWGQGKDITSCDDRVEYVVVRYKKRNCWTAKKETIASFPDRCLFKDRNPDVEKALRQMSRKWWDWPEKSPLRMC